MNIHKIKEVTECPSILNGHVDESIKNTIFTWFNKPDHFRQALLSLGDELPGDAYTYIQRGNREYDDRSFTVSKSAYDKQALEVRDILHGRGFTSKVLYGDPGFTNENTGMICKGRLMSGRSDYFYKNHAVTEGRIFHDIYVNLSYPGSIDNNIILRNAYALYALVKELSNIMSIRVIVVNHVTLEKNNRGLCYGYIVKNTGVPIDLDTFMFYLTGVKRTYGFALYDVVAGADTDAFIGRAKNTISIASLDIGSEIDNVWELYNNKKLRVT